MDVHHYDPATGEYIDTRPPRESPRDPGSFLIPANATTIAPPEAEAGKTRVFADGAWSLVADHRGETWWQARGQPVTVSDLGDPADLGLTATEPARTVEEHQAELRAAVSATLSTALNGGYSHDFGSVDATLETGETEPAGVRVLQTRDEDRANWLTSQAAYSAQVAAGNGAVAGAKFRTADNAIVTLSFADGLAVLLALAAWGAEVYDHCWTLKAAIVQAADDAALDAIDIETGWP